MTLEQPKKSEGLRSVLESLQTGAANRPGPAVSGLSPSQRILVASFYNPGVARRFQHALSAAGVRSFSEPDGPRTSVKVEYADRETAFQILAKQKQEYPDERPSGKRRNYDFSMVGAVFGGVIGVSSLIITSNNSLRVAVWLGFIGTGLLVGYVSDRMLRGLRYAGPFQFGMFDILLLMFSSAWLTAFGMFLVRLTR